MADELEKPEPKISLVVGVLGVIVCVVADVISLIPGAGDVEDVPALVVLMLSAVFKLGAPIIATQVVVDILKAIPVVQELPLWTPAWLFICWLENSNSRIAKRAQQAIDLTAAAEGNVGELGEAGVAAEEGVVAAGASLETAEVSAAAAEATSQVGNLEEEGRTATKPSERGSETEKQRGDESDKKDTDGTDIELGDEVSPEDQARDVDFGSSEEKRQSDDEDESEGEEQQNNNVVGINTRKPPQPPRPPSPNDQDLPKAA